MDLAYFPQAQANLYASKATEIYDGHSPDDMSVFLRHLGAELLVGRPNWIEYIPADLPGRNR